MCYCLDNVQIGQGDNRRQFGSNTRTVFLMELSMLHVLSACLKLLFDRLYDFWQSLFYCLKEHGVHTKRAKLLINSTFIIEYQMDGHYPFSLERRPPQRLWLLVNWYASMKWLLLEHYRVAPIGLLHLTPPDTLGYCNCMCVFSFFYWKTTG